MRSEDEVKRRRPQAVLVEHHGTPVGGRVRYEVKAGRRMLGAGIRRRDAWADALRYLRRTAPAGKRPRAAVRVPTEIAALSARATPDWKLATDRIAPGIVRAGPLLHYVNGSSQAQIAAFCAPAAETGDGRDTDAERRANTELAVACVNWVRQLLAEEAR